ncbi:MAG: hypothetical protein K2X48_09555 [Chitinophagaceae bacterium]|nr:hypothetical protein [Chitinophagaceae bacterium]
MHTLTVTITDKKALKAILALEEKKALRIVDDVSSESPALEGRPLSVAAFKTWIEEAENAPSLSLKSAKAQWMKKRNRLSKLIK